MDRVIWHTFSKQPTTVLCTEYCTVRCTSTGCIVRTFNFTVHTCTCTCMKHTEQISCRSEEIELQCFVDVHCVQNCKSHLPTSFRMLPSASWRWRHTCWGQMESAMRETHKQDTEFAVTYLAICHILEPNLLHWRAWYPTTTAVAPQSGFMFV